MHIWGIICNFEGAKAACTAVACCGSDVFAALQEFRILGTKKLLKTTDIDMTEKSETELILINISGQDRPGVTSALTEILGKYDASILDIGQADIHHTLALGILFKTKSHKSGDIMKELLFKAARRMCRFASRRCASTTTTSG